MEHICIEIIATGERRRIEGPLWIDRGRNGPFLTPHRIKAKGLGDGEQIWSLGGLEGYPEARLITLTEYLQSLAGEDPDPELTPEEALEIILGGNYEVQ